MMETNCYHIRIFSVAQYQRKATKFSLQLLKLKGGERKCKQFTADGHEGMENHSGYPNLTIGLISLGYSDEDITKIMGENFIRLVKEVIG